MPFFASFSPFHSSFMHFRLIYTCKDLFDLKLHPFLTRERNFSHCKLKSPKVMVKFLVRIEVSSSSRKLLATGIISKLAQQETPFIANVFARHKSYFINPGKMANDD